MGKIFKSMGRGIKLAFKTVTFHWKQYICFFIALLAMQIMFGIIVMSSSKSVADYTQTVQAQYDYHFALTNLSQSQRNTIRQRVEKTPYTPYIVLDEDNMFLKIYIDKYYDVENGSQKMSLEHYYYKFVEDYVVKSFGNANDTKSSEVSYLMTPLYNLEQKSTEITIECIIKIIVLALVSIAVIILLLNIRLNHFKFTYGIYMSFGADTKKLFSTNFWDMLIIGVITFIPAAIASILTTFFLFSPESGFAIGQLPKFLATQAPLVLFGLIFLIPICIIAVFIPTKLIAKQPPLKLLVAQDNSNLVSSPRISSQLLGKKFPGAYEGLGLFRFRRYIATVIASSVLFSAIFVWISFFSNIYKFNTEQEQAEFTINVNSQMQKVTEYVILGEGRDRDVTDDFINLRKEIYIENAYTKDNVEYVKKFESFYHVDYTIKYSNGNVSKVTKDGIDYTDEYWEVRKIILSNSFKNPISSSSQSILRRFQKFESYLLSGRDELNNNIPDIEYYNEVSEVNQTVIKVYKKDKQTRYTYPKKAIETQKSQISALETLLAGQYPLKKTINIELFGTGEENDKDAIFDSNYVYASFEDENVTSFSGIEYNRDVAKRVTDRIQISSIDSSNLNFLNQKYEMDIMGGYDDIVMSDLELTKDEVKYVIISETAANSQVLDIKPGDKIYLNSLSERQGTYNSTGDDLLRDLIAGETFTTQEFVVYAVIKNMPTSEMMPIYLLEKDYKTVMGVEHVIPNQFDIYVPANTTGTKIDELYLRLAEWGQKGYATIIWNNAVAENRETLEMNTLPVVQTIGVFALILSPLFWFFSQIMFYGKREDEFTLLRALGATEREIKRIFKKDGFVFAAIGAIATFIFGVVGVYVIHRLNMLYVAFFDNAAITLFRFEMPWLALIIACVATTVCGYVSTVIPYYINRSKARKTLNSEFGD